MATRLIILPSDWRARLPDPLDKRFTVEYRTLSLVKALKPWTQRGTDSFLGQMILAGREEFSIRNFPSLDPDDGSAGG